ncbi:DNA primase [Mycobacterium phage Salz]|nr:DNA primase [Mycobacterium phage Salz]
MEPVPVSVPRRRNSFSRSQLRPSRVQLPRLWSPRRCDLDHPTRRGGEFCRGCPNRRGVICGRQRPNTEKVCPEVRPKSIWRVGVWSVPRFGRTASDTWAIHSLVMRCSGAG